MPTTRRKPRGPARVASQTGKSENGSARKKSKKSEEAPFQFRYN
jgi:hypothetical protein